MNFAREALTMVLVLALVGFLAWVIITYVPMMPIFRTLIVVALVVLCGIWLINAVSSRSTS